MCNGLNYTKLNRRLTDIKSDWEKLVGKRILHTININIGTTKRLTHTRAIHPRTNTSSSSCIEAVNTLSPTIRTRKCGEFNAFLPTCLHPLLLH